MNYSFKDNAIKINQKITLFINTFLTAVLVVLATHILCLSIYAFTLYDWSLVVSGFDFGQWSVVGRSLILIPYLILPAVLATVKVTGFSLTDLWDTNKQTTKSHSQADE